MFSDRKFTWQCLIERKPSSLTFLSKAIAFLSPADDFYSIIQELLALDRKNWNIILRDYEFQLSNVRVASLEDALSKDTVLGHSFNLMISGQRSSKSA
jgi:hypothetical protein